LIEAFLTIGGAYFPITLFLAGLATGFVGAMGGPGGFIITPFLIFSGFSPLIAVATARFAAIVPWFIAIAKYRQANQVRTPEAYYLVAIGMVGGLLGTSIIINVNEDIIYPIVSITLLLLVPVMFIKKDFGILLQKYSKRRHTFGYILYFFVMVYGGFIGLGASVFANLVLVGFLGFRMLEAHSSHMLAWSTMSIFSSVIFAINGNIDYKAALITFAGMAIGSFIGSKIIVKKGNQWLKIIIAAFAVIVGLKILSDYV